MRQRLRHCAGAALLAVLCAPGAFVPGALAQPGADGRQLDEQGYRTELEEIIVRGTAPRWTPPEEEGRIDTRFQLPEHTESTRLRLLPAYDKEEREQYRQVRDRTGATPEIKLFEMQF